MVILARHRWYSDRFRDGRVVLFAESLALGAGGGRLGICFKVFWFAI